jgi:hypothetical protein
MPKVLLTVLTVLMSLAWGGAQAEIGVPIIEEPVHAGLDKVRVKGLTTFLVRENQPDLKIDLTVRIERLVPAADGSIPDDDPEIEVLGGRIAGGPKDLFVLDRVLQAGEVIRAVAEDGSDKTYSPRVQVSGTPDPLSPPRAAYRATLVENARCMAVEGLVAQGMARIYVAGETDPLGEAVADNNGMAQVNFNRAVTLADTLILESTLGAATGTRTQDPTLIVPRGYLGLAQDYQELHKALKVEAPRACDRYLETSQHELGADFTVKSAGAVTATNPAGLLFGPYCAAGPAWISPLTRPLERAWGSVSSSQEYTAITMPSEVTSADILDTEKPGTPEIEPVYAGMDQIHVKNLRPSAVVFLKHETGGIALPTRQHPGTEPILGLTQKAAPGDKITVWQKLCSLKSEEDVAEVDPAPPVLDPVTPVEPVYACAGSIEIDGVDEDAWVKAYVDDGTRVSDLSAFTPALEIDTAGTLSHHLRPNQSLVAGWRVAARQRIGATVSAIDPGAGWVTVRSVPELVSPPTLSDPSLPGLTIGARGLVGVCKPVVKVGANKGASLAISDGGLLNTATMAYQSDTIVPLPSGVLRPGAEIVAEQSICTTQSGPSQPLRAVGKVRITGDVLNRDLVFDGGTMWIELAVETQCDVAEDLVLQIATSKEEVLKIAPNAGSWGKFATIIIPKGQKRASLYGLLSGSGRTRLEITNWQNVGYAQTGPNSWTHDPASPGTEVPVWGWIGHSDLVSLSKHGSYPGLVSGMLIGEPALTRDADIRLISASHQIPDLELNIMDGPNPCSGKVLMQLGGFSGGSSMPSSANYPENNRPTSRLIYACGFGGPSLPWDLEVKYEQLEVPR